MKKSCLSILFSMLVVTNSYALESSFLDFGNKDYETRSSNWIFTTEINQIELPVKFPSFDGVHFDVKDKILKEKSTGVSLGFGGDVHLFYGLSSTFKISGFFHRTLNSTVGKAAKDIDVDLANKSSTNSSYGGEASISLNYIFETSMINIQPFVEYAQGRGDANFEKNYEFKATKVSSANKAYSHDESYDMSFKQSFDYTRVGAGINFVNSLGMISYIKASKSNMIIRDRKVKGSFSTTNSSDTENFNDSFEDLRVNDLLTYSAGIGFLF